MDDIPIKVTNSMEQSSVLPTELARKLHALALQRIHQVGQNTIAAEIGVSAPTVSRFVSEDLERACQVLAAAGLKVVPAEMQVFPPHRVQLLLDLARDHLQGIKSVEQLAWEDRRCTSTR